MIQELKALFKIARLLSSTNVDNFLQGQFFYMGSTTKGQIFIPYGTIGAPPDDSQMALFAQNANESNGIGFASDPRNRLKKDALPGEHGIANYTSGSFIFFDNQGNIQIVGTNDLSVTVSGNVSITVTGNVTLTSPSTTVTGDVTVNGKLVNNGITFEDHVHAQGNDSNGDAEVDTDPPK